ncbi:MAG: septum formation protein Maf [Dehalococcoidia bacterium]|nr:MAG: septum formation protein Maf [Dehalococcoidia bacterium]
MTPQLILASRSPRRRDLLAHLGVPFRVVVPEVEENGAPASSGQPEEVAETLALVKAEAVARDEREGIVIAADTIVVDGDTILGKPADGAEAAETLCRLRGREHRVITGLAVVDASSGQRVASHVVTAVRMRDYSHAEIAAYVARGDPLDKAGAYAIQDEQFQPVVSYEGCYCNVVGLPLKALLTLLRRAGLDITSHSFEELPTECAACPIVVD